MDPFIETMIKFVYMPLVFCGSALAFVAMRLRHERRMSEQRQSSLEAVQEEVDRLREEQAAQIAELQERVDFAERVLAQHRLAPPPKERIPTPV